MRAVSFVLSGVVVALMMSGCGSSAIKEKRKERERLAKTSAMYCEFVNAEINPDIELEINVSMAKKCDADKPFSLTQFKTPSENQGIMYCCSSLSKAAPPAPPPPPAAEVAPKAKPEEKNLQLEE